MEICSRFTGEHPCRSVISGELQSNFIEIALQPGCSPVNSLHSFRTPFLKNTSLFLVTTERIYSICKISLKLAKINICSMK